MDIYRLLSDLGLGCLLVWLVWLHLRRGYASEGVTGEVSKKQERHPHSPKDCPACRAGHKRCMPHAVAGVEAWRKSASGRGRPKTIETEGHACNNPGCGYFNITDGAVHALVGDGKHQGADTVQYFKCQACGTKVSGRWNTPLYDLKTPARRVAEVMTATSEGMDVSAAHRVFAHDERTIQRWLTRTARHAERAHERFFRNLVCQHLQLDELVTKVRGVKERVFVWVALDAHTKIMPVIRIGVRKSADAQLFVHELWQRLASGAPPVFTTDGLWLYYYALTAHFGHWLPPTGQRHPVWQVDPRLLYGQLHKLKIGYRLKSMYTVAVCGSRAQLRDALAALGLTGRIMTAYVERVNLTLREHVPPLSRRTWSLARNEHALRIHLEWGRAYYHFCRYHEGLRLPTALPYRYRSRTPAMAAGLARRRWPVRDFLLMPFPPA